MASAADHSLNRIEPPLPLGDRGVVTEAVFEEQERTARLEHAQHFAHRRARVAYRAYREGADGAVESVVVEGQMLGAEPGPFDRKARRRDSLGDPFRHQVLRID